MAMVFVALSACAQGGKPAPRSPKSSGLANKTITGTAKNAKGGAVVLTGEYGTVYVAGLDAWPHGLLDKRVKVTGTLTREKLIPDPVTTKSGEVSAGAYGDQTVIRDATWKLAE